MTTVANLASSNRDRTSGCDAQGSDAPWDACSANVEPDCGGAVSGDPLTALAVLMLNSDFMRSKLDEQNIVQARREQSEALAGEVKALHQAADDVRMGAWVQGGLTVAGAGLTIAARIATPPCEQPIPPGVQAIPLSVQPKGTLEVLTLSGSVLGALAQPLSKELGDAPSADANADAKQFEQQSTDASTRAEQASHQRDRVEQSEDRTLDALGSSVDAQSRANIAIISNV